MLFTFVALKFVKSGKDAFDSIFLNLFKLQVSCWQSTVIFTVTAIDYCSLLQPSPLE